MENIDEILKNVSDLFNYIDNYFKNDNYFELKQLEGIILSKKIIVDVNYDKNSNKEDIILTCEDEDEIFLIKKRIKIIENKLWYKNFSGYRVYCNVDKKIIDKIKLLITI